MSGFRLAAGGRIDRARALRFRFDGLRRDGFAGDTLASALIAEGVTLVARSFKLHRPRGVVAAGPEEPNALVELGNGPRREPNVSAPVVELFDGLVAASQNRFPSLGFDLAAATGALGHFLPAGFYYKTFMWPPAFWEKVYEPFIRRMAGLGRGTREPDPDRYDHVHDHCDVLVVGSGPAGLSAALAAARAGQRVILAEQDFEFGGACLVDPALEPWRRRMLDALADTGEARLLARATVVGAYDHGAFAAIERLGDHLAEPEPGRARRRLHVIRAKRAIVAAGATERLIAFPDNDRPGVILAGAARAYANRFAAAVGRRVALFANNDEAYAAARDLARHGVEIAAILDVRADSRAGREALAAGLPVRFGHEVGGVGGGRGVRGLRARPIGGRALEWIAADALLVSGGHTPNVQLASQSRAALQWNEAIAGFVPAATARVAAAGAARGVFGVLEAARDGAAAGDGGDVPLPDVAADAATPLAPFWEVREPGKSFVDLQHDVTADDMRLAHQEGYSHVEHAKRYTTHGMATDQGKIGGLVGSAILAAARGESVAAVGLPTFRPYVVPATWGALAGPETGEHFKPVRRLPLHDWHARHGAIFVRVGLWERPLVYSPSGDTSWGPVLEEARSVRRSVGINEGSSFGKLEIVGPDAAKFLDRVYCNTFSTLPVGRARYGLMLREDGLLFDDGTTSRLGPERFLMTTTTAKSAEALEHLEWHLQTVWPELDVAIANVADHWAQFAVAGPNSRRTLAAVMPGFDLSNEVFPFMAAAEAAIAGVPGRIFRISFSGELAYEVAVPASHAEPVWEAILAAGKPFDIRPYGLDALNLMRIEKGHVTAGELNGQTTARDLGLGKMMKKSGDFVGRALGERPGLIDPDRMQLVGIRPVDRAQRLRNGAQLVPAGGPPSHGFITSSCMAAEGEGWIGLALLARGQSRHGETLTATSPIWGEDVAVEIVSPHMLDAENVRVRA